VESAQGNLPEHSPSALLGDKTMNVLNKVALSVQVNMKADLREIYGRRSYLPVVNR
jgi:hypothetical protein